MKKTGFRFSYLFMGLVLVIMYLPILLLVIYSFNESKISSVWGGFSLKWYRDLFRDECGSGDQAGEKVRRRKDCGYSPSGYCGTVFLHTAV